MILAARNVALSHMDPMRFLTTEDQVEVLAMTAISQLVSEAYKEAAKG